MPLTHINRSQHLHEAGAYGAPSPSVFDPYSTTYSRTHDFTMGDKAVAYRSPDLPSSGFVHGHKRTNTANTSGRFCGQTMSQQMVTDNGYPTTMQSQYTRTMSDPLSAYLSKSGMQTLVDVPAHNKINRDTPEKLGGVGAGGYNRNQISKIQYGGRKLSNLSETKQQMQYISQPHEELRSSSQPWELRKGGNGYIKNQQPSINNQLTADEALDWMTTTNTARERSSSRARDSFSAQQKAARVGNPETSGFCRQIMEPPCNGVGTEQMKLRGIHKPVKGGLAAKNSSKPRPYTATTAELPYRSADQAYYNMAQLRPKNPVEYNFNLKGADMYSQTSKIGSASREMVLEHKVPDLSGFAETNNPGSKSEGKYYLKNPSSMYTTTKNIDERYFARYQADISDRAAETLTTQYNSGFSVNNKASYKGVGQGQGPSYSINMKTGVHLFGEEPPKIGSEERGFLTSSRVVGDGTKQPPGPIANPANIKRDFVNKNFQIQSGFGREANYPPLPLAALKGGMDIQMTDKPGFVEGALGKIQRDFEPAKSKNWGEGI